VYAGVVDGSDAYVAVVVGPGSEAVALSPTGTSPTVTTSVAGSCSPTEPDAVSWVLV
jgi:hypothetical protein